MPKASQTKKEISKSKKIYNAVSTAVVLVIFVFLVVLVGFMLFQRKNGGDASIFGYYFFDVVTDSMKDAINPGDVIISKKVEDANALKVGDIITFVAPSGPLQGRNETHRIVEIIYSGDNAEYFKTKGDNSVAADNWQIKASEVKAVYVKTSQFIGGLREFLSHWYGYVVLIVIPLLIVGVLFIVGFVRDRAALELEKQGIEDGKSPTIDRLSDEDKKKLLDEYLSKSEENKIGDSHSDGEKSNNGDEFKNE